MTLQSTATTAGGAGAGLPELHRQRVIPRAPQPALPLAALSASRQVRRKSGRSCCISRWVTIPASWPSLLCTTLGHHSCQQHYASHCPKHTAYSPTQRDMVFQLNAAILLLQAVYRGVQQRRLPAGECARVAAGPVVAPGGCPPVRQQLLVQRRLHCPRYLQMLPRCVLGRHWGVTTPSWRSLGTKPAVQIVVRRAYSSDEQLALENLNITEISYTKQAIPGTVITFNKPCRLYGGKVRGPRGAADAGAGRGRQLGAGRLELPEPHAGRRGRVLEEGVPRPGVAPHLQKPLLHARSHMLAVLPTAAACSHVAVGVGSGQAVPVVGFSTWLQNHSRTCLQHPVMLLLFSTARNLLPLCCAEWAGGALPGERRPPCAAGAARRLPHAPAQRLPVQVPGPAAAAAIWCWRPGGCSLHCVTLPVHCCISELGDQVVHLASALNRSRDDVYGEQLFRVDNDDLQPGTYTIGIFNMDYFVHQSFSYQLAVRVAEDSIDSLYKALVHCAPSLWCLRHLSCAMLCTMHLSPHT